MKFTTSLFLAITAFSAGINAVAIPVDSNVEIVINVKDEPQTQTSPHVRVFNAETLDQPLGTSPATQPSASAAAKASNAASPRPFSARSISVRNSPSIRGRRV
ncbi:hypothetical protein HYFRA_00005500 [Hymenoscyphus fraxineus]|uniref:Uncharacterized protein n=1 Tax=Hymenoscyphus fraxineus TaxID=746836 RepID=A0A9N9KPL4_9HELO|nr:hypothetical protein HYFRA_00005500 [Hymenoscyphus fraxineus]